MGYTPGIQQADHAGDLSEKEKLERELTEDLPQKVELGVGKKKPEGFLGVDVINTEQADVQQDLDEEDWVLPSNHFLEARSVHLFEHLENPIHFVENCHDILAEGGKLYIESPHLSTLNWHDPTHKRLVGSETAYKYFTEDGDFSYYTDAEFEVENVRINFAKRKLYPWNYLVEPLVNLSQTSQQIFEQTFLSRLFPAESIQMTLRKPSSADEKLRRIGEHQAAEEVFK